MIKIASGPSGHGFAGKPSDHWDSQKRKPKDLFFIHSIVQDRIDNQMQREHRVRYAAELVLVCIICYLLCIKYSAVSAPENMLGWW